MYVCICNGITEKQVRQAANDGVTSLLGLQQELGVASNCGKCGDTASEILRETHSAKRAEPVVYFPATA